MSDKNIKYPKSDTEKDYDYPSYILHEIVGGIPIIDEWCKDIEAYQEAIYKSMLCESTGAPEEEGDG